MYRLVFFSGLLLWYLGGSPLSAQVVFNQVNAGVGYWHRSYSDLDERLFFTGGMPDAAFYQGSPMAFIGAEVGLGKHFGVEGRVAYWRSVLDSHLTIGGTNIPIAERLDQQIMPLYGGVVYNFRDVVPRYMHAFVGAGVSRYLIENKFTRISGDGRGSLPELSRRGNSYGMNAKAGLEYLFPDYFSIVLEGRYHLANYRQAAYREGEESPVPQAIGLFGWELSLSIRFALGY